MSVVHPELDHPCLTHRRTAALQSVLMPAHQGSYKLVIDREILDGTDETYVSVSAASSSSVHDRYEVIKFIGKGAFANVYLGKDKMNGGQKLR